jgi:tetratricopeptide (TPR) repeat protein
LTTRFSGNRRHGLALLVSLLITTLALPANAGTVTGLLEKAIYTEETVGDLEEAIEIYQKVLAESKNSINAAAQAQFRIGTCYAKQGKTDEAAIAFQAVVDDYPQAAEWVAQAKSRLPGNPELLPVPWGRRR